MHQSKMISKGLGRSKKMSEGEAMQSAKILKSLPPGVHLKRIAEPRAESTLQGFWCGGLKTPHLEHSICDIPSNLEASVRLLCLSFCITDFSFFLFLMETAEIKYMRLNIAESFLFLI
jgi:hypothetical protein